MASRSKPACLCIKVRISCSWEINFFMLNREKRKKRNWYLVIKAFLFSSIDQRTKYVNRFCILLSFYFKNGLEKFFRMAWYQYRLMKFVDLIIDTFAKIFALTHIKMRNVFFIKFCIFNYHMVLENFVLSL